ncbi:MAG TPA: hypothetical protein PKD20_02360 [Candidatus Saccharibacteria bacterium]|nr:hypothetical protein [Candidatus Saccharibacteria bacterium]HMT55698.1 hypothetical protein [Candidatus Saccharibacteria bacterium]
MGDACPHPAFLFAAGQKGSKNPAAYTNNAKKQTHPISVPAGRKRSKVISKMEDF